MKRNTIALTIIVAIVVGGLVAILFVGEIGEYPFDGLCQNDLLIASFIPQTLGSQLTGGSIVLVNPTDKNFEDLTLTITIDDSELIVPFLRLLNPLSVEGPLSNYSVLVTRVSVEAGRNETIQLYLFDPAQNEPPFPQTIFDVQTFSSHIISFYVTKDAFGDVINGQSFLIPQEKALLKIISYSSVEYSNDTWHEYYNDSKKRYEYVNDKPNFFQRNSKFFPLDPDSYSWAKRLNQIGEHYYNVTILNNSTFPVKGIAYLPNGNGSIAFAVADMILQPNLTYVLAVQTSGENWWSAETVYELSNFSPAQTYATGDLLGN